MFWVERKSERKNVAGFSHIIYILPFLLSPLNFLTVKDRSTSQKVENGFVMTRSYTTGS